MKKYFSPILLIVAIISISIGVGAFSSPFVKPAEARGLTPHVSFPSDIFALETESRKSVITTPDRAADLCAALGMSMSQGTFCTAAQVVTLNPNATVIVTCDCVPSPALATYWGIVSANSQDDYPQFSFEQANNR